MDHTGEFIRSRARWASVEVMRDGDRFDVALVIDGHYSTEAEAEQVAKGHAAELVAAMRADGVDESQLRAGGLLTGGQWDAA